MTPTYGTEHLTEGKQVLVEIDTSKEEYGYIMMIANGKRHMLSPNETLAEVLDELYDSEKHRMGQAPPVSILKQKES